MTVTIVFGKTTDGYLYSYDAAYATSRNGPADGVTGGTAMYIGQNNNAGQYATFEAFTGYDYSAIPSTEVVTACLLRTYVLNILNTGLNQDVEWRGYGWSGGGLVVADWRTGTQLAASRLDGITHITSAAKSTMIQTASDELLAAMRTVTSMEHVVTTARMRAGNTATSDEGIALSSADESGTTFDPCMVYTSCPRSTLFGVLGAQVETSFGWAYLESNGAATPTITLKHRHGTSGTITTIATLPVAASGTNQFAIPEGAQALALVKDPSDNLYVMGRLADAENNLAILTFAYGGAFAWTQKAMRSTTLPAYNSAINQVAALWHPPGTPGLVAFVNHVGSAGDSVTHNELHYVIFNPTPLLAGDTVTSPIRGQGYALPALGPTSPPSGYFNSWHNETGSGMDVASPQQYGGSSDQAYLFSWGVSQNLGDNKSLSEGWYILNSGSTGFQWTKNLSVSPYGRKDAAGKVRVVPVSSQAAAFISTDSDSTYGITVQVRIHTGTDSTSIGYVTLANEGIASMPDGPAVAQTSSWDAIYNGTENRLWIYYVDAADAGKLRRTAIDMSTMLAVKNEIVVYDDPGTATITSVRVQRNRKVAQNSLVTIALNTAGVLSTVYVVDTFNAAPTAPTLTPKSNFDATTAQTFAWTFNDPNPGDAQSAYQLIITNSATSVVAFDSGKVASATPSRLLAANAIANGNSYTWSVRTWDTLDAAGPYSALGSFTTSAGGTVSITSPATDYPDGIVTSSLPIVWAAAGTVQAAYRIWLYRGATLVSDSNWVASTATTATVTGMLSDQAHRVDVQIRNAGAVTTNVASRYITPSFSTPEKPLVVVTPYEDQGYVLVSVENPAPGAPSLGYAEEGFESGIGTWTASTGSTFAVDATDPHRGTNAGKLAVTVAGQTQYFARDYTNKKAVTPGVRYTARMWVKRSADGNAGPAIDWQDASGVYISTSAVGLTVTGGVWTRVEVTGTAPANAAFCSYGPSLAASPGVGVSLLLDEVVLTAASDKPDVTSNDILRRIVGAGGLWEVIGSIGPDGVFRDYTATKGVVYEYKARGQA